MLVSVTATARAQVVRDGSIGPGLGANEPTGPDYQIPASLGDRRGDNLFHSFQRFDLQIGDAATFTGSGARHILARVTGGAASSINGRINAEANLFLMNPAGIVFHEHASINVTGSFFATTADSIKLGSDGHFRATTNPQDSVLSVAAPSAFGFMTPNPAAIHVHGSKLSLPGDKTLGLVGGDVSITGEAILEAGDVQILSVRSVGEAGLQLPTVANGLRFASINANHFAQHGAVTVGQPTAAGEPPPPRAAVAAHRVVIRGGTFVMKNANVTAQATNPGDGISLHVSQELNLGDQSILQANNAGDLRGAATVDVSAGSAALDFGSLIISETSETGAGGDLRLNVNGSLTFTRASGLDTTSASAERGGDVFVSASDFSLDNSIVRSFADEFTKSGDIHLEVSGSLSLRHESEITLTPGQSSNAQIIASANDILVSDLYSRFFFYDQSSEGIAGSVILTAKGSLSVLNGGVVSATTVGRDGASVAITAGNVLISGRETPDLPTGIIAETISGPGTRGGDIRMDVTGLLQVLDGGTISTNALAQGNGGNIVINGRDVTVTGLPQTAPTDALMAHGITARSVPLSLDGVHGDSGSIQLNLSGRLEVRDFGEIVVDTRGSGRGGNIGINTNELLVSSGGLVAARTFATEGGGRGGNLTIDTSGQLEVAAGGQINAGTFGSGAGGTIALRGKEIVLNGQGALISAVSGSPEMPGTGTGGNLTIDANRLRIGNDAQITASTFGPGAGGNVNVNAQRLSIVDDDRTFLAGINAQTLAPGAGGPGGMVQVDARNLEMSGSGAAISTQSFGFGNSGRVQIATETLALSDGSAIQSSSTGLGNAGSVGIAARGDITLTGGSLLSVASAQSNAGDINVRSETSITLTDSSITARAALDGGSIDLRARDLLFLTNSQITAEAGVNGGNIFIDPTFVVLDQSVISANAILGRGGNVRIISDFFLATDSLVTATSELGIDGSVRIDALNADLTGNLVELPSKLLNAESLLQELCTVKVEGFSSFISEGRGGLPPLPGEALPSLMIVR
jgi:filamentous hemagglutinin family protein